MGKMLLLTLNEQEENAIDKIIAKQSYKLYDHFVDMSLTFWEVDTKCTTHYMQDSQLKKKDSISVESQLEYCRYESHGEACIAFRQAYKAKAALFKGIGFQSNTFQ